MDLNFLIQLLRKRHALAVRNRWRRSVLESFQAARLAELRRFTLARSPFYGRFHAGLENAPLSALPVLTKAALMENFDSLATDRALRLSEIEPWLAGPGLDGLYQGKYVVAATSGSTGRKGIFLYDRDEWSWVLASYARANDWAGVPAGLLHRLKLAVVSTRTPWHQSARVGASLRSRCVPTLRLDATEPLEAIVTGLNAFRPESLVGYASMIRLLAREQASGRLAINPAAVFTASEVLTREARMEIKDAWGKEPFDVYASTETAGIASECGRHESQHLYEDLVIAENVDEANRPVPADRFGAKLLVTVLFSRTLPLIRYELTDSVRLTDRLCPCGLPFGLLTGVQGRTEDLLAFPGRSGEVVIQPNVFHNHLEKLPAEAWQVSQESESGLCVRVAGLRDPGAAGKIVAGLRLDLETRGAVIDSLRLENVTAMPRGATGKISLISAYRKTHQGALHGA